MPFKKFKDTIYSLLTTDKCYFDVILHQSDNNNIILLSEGHILAHALKRPIYS